MQAAIPWLNEHGYWRKAPFMCDCKSLVDAVGNSLALEEGIRQVKAAATRFNAKKFLEVLWIPGHCGLQGNE